MDSMRGMQYFRVAALLLMIMFHGCNTTDLDTITQNHFISDAGKGALVSSNGNFKLGFFSPIKSPNRYVGIWFNKVPQQTVVWVANRDTPLKNTSGVFKITDDGNIAVFYSDNERLPLWSSNASMPTTTNSTAKLLPSGNLVLMITTNGSDHTETVAWQSFDYPTDTLLAEMKFGLDKRTGLNRILTSWKSDDDPAHGEFSIGLESRGLPQFFLYKGSTVQWRAGPWNGRTLSGLQPVASTQSTQSFDISNFSYVNTPDEVYGTFNAPSPLIFSILILKPLGTIQRQVWRPETQQWVLFYEAPQDRCDHYRWCGASSICNNENTTACKCLPGFEYSQVSQTWDPYCVEKRKLAHTCGKGDGEGFITLPHVKVPDARICRLFANLSLEECKMECLKNCNCTGYASADINVGGRGCLAWYGQLNDTKQYSQDGQDFYIRVDASELAANMIRKNSKGFGGVKRTLVIIIVSVALGALLFIFCSCYLWREHAKRKVQRLDIPSQDNNRSNEDEDLELPLFDLVTISTATNNFSFTNKIGEGGFGPVYRGKLSTGQETAVKRLSKDSGQGMKEFKNEVILIAKLQHRNLVRLLGCCIHGEERMLIYEYMPNKSLDLFIFNQTRGTSLDWRRRFDIIVGIARGLVYLHRDSRLRIIHRDLKASNILLDSEMNPKISDFGLARTFGGDQSEVNTNRIMGTYGYMSPEYAIDGIFSVKSDVFSFGVLVLEVVSGRKNRGFYHPDHELNLLGHAWKLWNEGNSMKLMDAYMENPVPASQVLRCIQVGLLCLQQRPEDRPTMSSVLLMLDSENPMLPQPKQPGFYSERFLVDTHSSSTGKRPCTSNEVTVTMLQGR